MNDCEKIISKIEALKVKLKTLQNKCKHENIYYSYMNNYDSWAGIDDKYVLVNCRDCFKQMVYSEDSIEYSLKNIGVKSKIKREVTHE